MIPRILKIIFLKNFSCGNGEFINREHFDISANLAQIECPF
jgi:hypothetical protein